jgi:hypothetical protein
LQGRRFGVVYKGVLGLGLIMVCCSIMIIMILLVKVGG